MAGGILGAMAGREGGLSPRGGANIARSVANLGRGITDYWLNRRLAQDMAGVEQQEATASLMESVMKHQDMLQGLERRRSAAKRVATEMDPTNFRKRVAKKQARAGRLPMARGVDVSALDISGLGGRAAKKRKKTGKKAAEADLVSDLEDIDLDAYMAEIAAAQQQRQAGGLFDAYGRHMTDERRGKRAGRERQIAGGAGIANLLEIMASAAGG